jgi:hypothetical protein
MASVGDGNGGTVPIHLERRDKMFLGVAGLLLASVVPLSLYVFQTRGDAAAETAVRVAAEKQIEMNAALHEQEAKLLREADTTTDAARDKRIKVLGAGLTAIHANQQKRMIEDGFRKREIKPLPAGIAFDDIDAITKPAP